MYLLNVAELEGEWEAQLIDKTRLKGYVLNGNLTIQQPDV